MELPNITASSYVSSASDAANLMRGLALGAQGIAPQQRVLQDWLGEQVKAQQNPFQPPVQPKKEQPVSAARIVKVFIADPSDAIPLEKRVLYTGEEKLTDLTDQELFFEVPIKELLDKHNEYRKTVVDKKKANAAAAVEYLEPARIRDLKMVVVTVAQF